MLPKTVDPVRFAKQQAQLDGDVLLKHLPRLQEMCDQENQKVHVVLRFDVESRLTVIHGKITGSVRLICQRCNSPMHFDIDISFLLSPVTCEERANNLPAHVEPVFMQDESVLVNDMIEDEILLALPMVAKHPDNRCIYCSHKISC